MDKIIEFYISTYQYDLERLSDPWMYYPLLVPIIGYAIFMGFKWWLITMPLWLPIRLCLGGNLVKFGK